MTNRGTLDGRLRVTATERPDAPAVRFAGMTTTWAGLDARADAAAAALDALDVRAGDRVAVVLPNVPVFLEAWFGVLRRGAVAVPAATVLAPDEHRHLLAASGASVLVTTAAVAAGLAPLREDLADLRHVVVVDGDPGAGADHEWGVLLDGAASTTPGVPGHGPDDLAALVFTSGTSGRPRGAMLTHGQLVANQDQSLAGPHGVGPDDRVLVVLPLFHVYGLNVGLGPSVAVGATMVLQERFEAVATARLIADEGVTVLLGAPQMYVAWTMAPPGEALATVRLAASGAAPLPPAVHAAFAQLTSIGIREGYGLTEAGPAVTSGALDDEVRAGWVGRALPDVELRIVERGEDVPVGELGEVWVRGPNVFSGYWNDGGSSDDTLDDDGWLHTGDVGVLDAGGWLRLVDRRGDLVIVSGFNVYPREVERVLDQHPGVARSAVVGIPHPVSGEAVRAFVVPSDAAATPTPGELVDHCRSRLARYKCPADVRVVDELPLTVTGKVRRSELRLP